MEKETKGRQKPVRVKKRKGKIKIKKKAVVKKSCDQLKAEHGDSKNIDLENKEQVEFLKCISTENREQLGRESAKYPYLYPSLGLYAGWKPPLSKYG